MSVQESTFKYSNSQRICQDYRLETSFYIRIWEAFFKLFHCITFPLNSECQLGLITRSDGITAEWKFLIVLLNISSQKMLCCYRTFHLKMMCMKVS
jgi:hypothetical protein